MTQAVENEYETLKGEGEEPFRRGQLDSGKGIRDI
jgi:hypothetical protein